MHRAGVLRTRFGGYGCHRGRKLRRRMSMVMMMVLVVFVRALIHGYPFIP
jgi:hypothetical protein